jgi:hypothetical protein
MSGKFRQILATDVTPKFHLAQWSSRMIVASGRTDTKPMVEKAMNCDRSRVQIPVEPSVFDSDIFLYEQGNVWKGSEGVFCVKC